MDKFDYNKSVTTANRLINKFGQTGSIERQVNSGSGWNPSQDVKNYACRLVVLYYLAKDIDGTLIKSGDLKVYIPAYGLEVTPKTTDKIVFNGVKHTVVAVTELSPAGVPIYYLCQCRS